MSMIYSINKGFDKPIVFRGLQGQYIWYLAAGLAALLFLFVLLYLAGLPGKICLPLVALLGTFLFQQVYRLNRLYGVHGWMKNQAKCLTPKRIYCNRLFNA